MSVSDSSSSSKSLGDQNRKTFLRQNTLEWQQSISKTNHHRHFLFETEHLQQTLIIFSHNFAISKSQGISLFLIRMFIFFSFAFYSPQNPPFVGPKDYYSPSPQAPSFMTQKLQPLSGGFTSQPCVSQKPQTTQILRNSMILLTRNAFDGQSDLFPTFLARQGYGIQMNSQHKLYIFSILSLNIMKNMNQVYQGWQYFALENDPIVDYLPLEAYPRKPSSDDILCDLVAQNTGSMTEEAPFRNLEINLENSASSSANPKKQKKKREVTKTAKDGQERGHWKSDENKRYHWFLELHCNHFLNKHLRRMDKIFKSMEKFIGTREAEQCRSHHQKMEKKHGNFINILRQLRYKTYGDGGIDAITEEIRASGIECGELLTLDPIEQKIEVLETDKSSLSEPSQEEEVDLLHELNRQYEPNISFLMF